MIKRFLLLLAIVFTISSTMSCPCCGDSPSQYIEIINNSEYDITSAVIIENGYIEEPSGEIIAKNGGSYVFYPGLGLYIVCVKTEDIPEFMCVDEFELRNHETKTFVWNSKDDPMWKPIRYIEKIGTLFAIKRNRNK